MYHVLKKIKYYSQKTYVPLSLSIGLRKQMTKYVAVNISLREGQQPHAVSLFLKKWAFSSLFLFIFGCFQSAAEGQTLKELLQLFLLKQTVHFLKQINLKNSHRVSGGGIQTHDLCELKSPPIQCDQTARLIIHCKAVSSNENSPKAIENLLKQARKFAKN